MIEHAVDYGSRTLSFAIERVERTSLDIAVTPDGRVIVRAPFDASDAAVAAGVRRRARWIAGQQRYFAQFTPRTPPRRWIPGETHLYLGRQYRLRIGDADARARVRLTGGYFLVDGVIAKDSISMEKVMHSWYRAHAGAVFDGRVEAARARIGAALIPASIPLSLRDMRTRWASMSPSGRLTVNPSLVRAPRDGIDYVITHELCHLVHADHGREFSEMLTRVMPDWEMRKLRMERALA